MKPPTREHARDLAAHAARLLDGARSARVAVVSRGDDQEAVAALESALAGPGTEIHRVRAGAADLHARLAAGGPYEVVLDVAGAGAASRLKRFFFHTRPGGWYLSSLQLPDSESRRKLEELVRRLVAASSTGSVVPPGRERDGRTNRQRDDDALAWSVAAVEQTDDHVAVRNRADALAKLDESEMATYLEADDRHDDRVLATVPATTWTSRCRVDSCPTSFAEQFPATYDAPALALREYRDVVCAPRQVVFRDNVVLPDSYNRIGAPRLRNPAFVEWAPGFVQRPQVEPVELPGSWFHLDNVMRGHFGHALTEQISHLWAWRAAKERHPDLRALVFPRQDAGLAGWEYELLAAAGIDETDLHVAAGPVRVESLLASTPMFSRPHFVHPAIRETYDRMGETLAAGASAPDWPARVFFSRRTDKRRCHNADEVEGIFASHGFHVTYPEDHPLPDQVAFVRRAAVVAGFAGSGMFHIAFAGGPRHVIVVGSENYPSHNEYMISSVLGHRLDLVACRADLAPEGDRFSQEAFHSDFTYDEAREGEFLRRVLSGL